MIMKIVSRTYFSQYHNPSDLLFISQSKYRRNVRIRTDLFCHRCWWNIRRPSERKKTKRIIHQIDVDRKGLLNLPHRSSRFLMVN